MMVIYATQDFAFNIVLAQGCMSDFFSVIGALMYAVKHNAAGVKVIFHSKYYSDVNVKEGRMDENYFNYFYEPNPMIINENIKHPKEVRYACMSLLLSLYMLILYVCLFLCVYIYCFRFILIVILLVLVNGVLLRGIFEIQLPLEMCNKNEQHTRTHTHTFFKALISTELFVVIYV